MAAFCQHGPCRHDPEVQRLSSGRHAASGNLVEVLPQTRLNSPLAYWLLRAPRSDARPEVRAFCDWLRLQAAQTREAIGDVAAPETADGLD